MHLPEHIKDGIIACSKRYDIERVLLFGSRARGDHHPRSDIDLAISGGDALHFTFALEEEIPTLLSFDVVRVDDPIQDQLLANIQREGILLYGKNGKL